MGKYDEAIQLMTGRRFAVWEGGTLTVADSWIDAHLLRGHQRLAQKRYREALADYQSAGKLPENIPSDRGESREAEISYWIGCADEALGNLDQAKAAWQKSASVKPSNSTRQRRPSGSNAQTYYQAMSMVKLGQADEAKKLFQAMLDSASQSLTRDSSATDSTDLPDRPQSPRARQAQSHYLAGLAYLGLGEKDKAKRELAQALDASPDHLGAKESLARVGP